MMPVLHYLGQKYVNVEVNMFLQTQTIMLDQI